MNLHTVKTVNCVEFELSESALQDNEYARPVTDMLKCLVFCPDYSVTLVVLILSEPNQDHEDVIILIS